MGKTSTHSVWVLPLRAVILTTKFLSAIDHSFSKRMHRRVASGASYSQNPNAKINTSYK